MLGLVFVDFNLFEGVFWLLLACISFYAARIIKMPPIFWRILALDFAFFGISDFVEAYYPVSFLDPGGEWLLAWKASCVIVFWVCVIWYLFVRMRK